MGKQALVFVFYNKHTNLVLLENRIEGQMFAGIKIFPGGRIEKNELSNFDKTLKRECLEEFGIIPKDYVRLQKFVLGESGNNLWIYLITGWTGKLPDKVRDKGSLLEWLNLNDFKCELKSVMTISDMVKKYLVSHNVVDFPFHSK